MLKLFYRAKRLKHEKQNTTLPFYTALLSMILCMVCLAGTTWAWFTTNQVVEVESITAAEWAIESVEVYQLENNAQQSRTASDGDAQRSRTAVDVTSTNDGVKFEASADTQYLVRASMSGNSSNGFLFVETCDGAYYTTDSDVSFNLLLTEDSTVVLSASWGAYFGEAGRFPENMSIGNGEVPVCSCDTLCTDEVANEECKVCSDDYSACTGKVPECSCTQKCTEDAFNGDCPVCATESTDCAGEELKECICTNKCEDTENVDCPVCAENKEVCTGEKVEPTQETTPTAGADTEQEDTVSPPASEPEVTESPTIEDPDSSEGQETSETPEIVEAEETTESTDIITESTSESESEDTLDTEDIATDANADKADISEAVSDGDVETTEEHDAPEA